MGRTDERAKRPVTRHSRLLVVRCARWVFRQKGPGADIRRDVHRLDTHLSLVNNTQIAAF